MWVARPPGPDVWRGAARYAPAKARSPSLTRQVLASSIPTVQMKRPRFREVKATQPRPSQNALTGLQSQDLT